MKTILFLLCLFVATSIQAASPSWNQVTNQPSHWGQTNYSSDGTAPAETTWGQHLITNANGNAVLVSDSNGSVASGQVPGSGASGQGSSVSGFVDANGSSMIANSAGSRATGQSQNGSSIQATSAGASASGNVNNGTQIIASGAASQAFGTGFTAGASVQAQGDGSMAFGIATGGPNRVVAASQASQAWGYAFSQAPDGTGSLIQANNGGTSAYGLADQGGIIEAFDEASSAYGYATGSNSVIMANGNGTVTAGAADSNGHLGTIGSFGQSTQGSFLGGYAHESTNVLDHAGQWLWVGDQQIIKGATNASLMTGAITNGGAYTDSTGSPGTSGQALVSTVTGTRWQSGVTTVIATNFVIGQYYTNASGRVQESKASVEVDVPASGGNAQMVLLYDPTGGHNFITNDIVGMPNDGLTSDLVSWLHMDGFMPNGSVFYFTNFISGSGFAAKVVSDTGQLVTFP